MAREALQACRELFARVEDGAGLVPLDKTGAVVLALEREFEMAELQSIVLQLSTRDDGGLDFIGLCEVVSYVMKGAQRTSEQVTLLDRVGGTTTVTLAEVAALQLKSLYSTHEALDDQRCWLRSEETFPQHTVAFGEGLATAFTHQQATFAIQARDWLHNDVKRGGDAFEVRLRGNQNTTATVVDNGDGSYTASYSINITGVYAVHVTLKKDRTHIMGSPFALLVSPDATQPLQCSAEGAGLQGALAGQPASFMIYKKNRHGQPRLRGNDHFYADVKGPGRWDCQIKDNLDGSYTVTYVARASGAYTVAVGLAPNGGQIVGSPFEVPVRPSAVDARSCVLASPPPSVARCGEELVLVLSVRDKFGNVVGEACASWRRGRLSCGCCRAARATPC